MVSCGFNKSHKHIDHIVESIWTEELFQEHMKSATERTGEPARNRMYLKPPIPGVRMAAEEKKPMETKNGLPPLPKKNVETIHVHFQ